MHRIETERSMVALVAVLAIEAVDNSVTFKKLFLLGCNMIRGKGFTRSNVKHPIVDDRRRGGAGATGANGACPEHLSAERIKGIRCTAY